MPSRPQDREEALALATFLGERVRQLRHEHGMTQRELADLVGITTQAFARLERGLSLPSFPTFIRICSTLHTSADFLLGVSETAEPSSDPQHNTWP